MNEFTKDYLHLDADEMEGVKQKTKELLQRYRKNVKIYLTKIGKINDDTQ